MPSALTLTAGGELFSGVLGQQKDASLLKQARNFMLRTDISLETLMDYPSGQVELSSNK